MNPEPKVIRICRCDGIGPIKEGCDGLHGDLDTPLNGDRPASTWTLIFVRLFLLRRGIPPTIREIAKATGTSKHSTFQRLQRLEKHGEIARGVRGARATKVLTRFRVAP